MVYNDIDIDDLFFEANFLRKLNEDLKLQIENKSKDIREQYGRTVFLEYPINLLDVKVDRKLGIVYEEK